MKMRITKEDIAMLSEDQRQNLSQIWRPEKYDLAMARVCTDITTDSYEEFEFVVGNIDLHGTHIYLTDLSGAVEAASDTLETTLSDEELERLDDTSEDASEEYDYFNAEDEVECFDEEDLEVNYQRPTVFGKQDCVPLLNLGQMIDLLEQANFNHCDFYMTVSTLEKGCELGKTNTHWVGRTEFEPTPLCDVLWDAMKQLL